MQRLYAQLVSELRSQEANRVSEEIRVYQSQVATTSTKLEGWREETLLLSRGQGHMKGHLQGVGATEVGQHALRHKRRGRNILVYLYFHPPISWQFLPLSKSIRKSADRGGWQMQPAEANLLAIQNRTEEGKGRGLGEQSWMAQCPTSHHSTP